MMGKIIPLNQPTDYHNLFDHFYENYFEEWITESTHKANGLINLVLIFQGSLISIPAKTRSLIIMQFSSNEILNITKRCLKSLSLVFATLKQSYRILIYSSQLRLFLSINYFSLSVHYVQLLKWL